MATLGDDEIEQRRAAVPEWQRDGDAITRDLKFDDFRAAVAFVNEVAEAAEAVNHHPDILVHGWNKVRLTLTTHSEGRVTDSDRAMAQRIDGLGG